MLNNQELIYLVDRFVVKC